MVWCPTCGEDVEADYNETGAMTACVNCGRVLEDAAFASDVTFMKGADGEGEMVGQFVGDDGTVRGLQRMAGGKVWSSRVSGGVLSSGLGEHVWLVGGVACSWHRDSLLRALLCPELLQHLCCAVLCVCPCAPLYTLCCVRVTAMRCP